MTDAQAAELLATVLDIIGAHFDFTPVGLKEAVEHAIAEHIDTDSVIPF